MSPSASDLAPGVRYAVLGNPENRRVALFQQALAERSLPPARVLSYADLLCGRAAGDELFDGERIVRLESPGENRDVERLLILRGARCSGRDDVADDAMRDSLADRGRIVHPHLWFAGFADLLRELEAKGRRAAWMNHPADVRLMFDKPACQRRLARAGVPVPEPLGLVGSFAELCDLRAQRRVQRVFVKLPCSSSASGVIALAAGRRRVRATTSVELVRARGEVRLYNSLQVRHYDDPVDVALLVDALAGGHALYVERWLPKAGWEERTFDLRVLVIAGQVRHVVMRTSRGPITNLHLGNRRGDVDRLRDAVPTAAWRAAEESCLRAAACFPQSLYCGIDLMFTPNWRQHAVLEVNAFGDLLPGVRHEGEGPSAAEILAQQQLLGVVCR